VLFASAFFPFVATLILNESFSTPEMTAILVGASSVFASTLAWSYFRLKEGVPAKLGSVFIDRACLFVAQSWTPYWGVSISNSRTALLPRSCSAVRDDAITLRIA
jgi:hypothetical protein